MIASLRPLCPSLAVICCCHIGFISRPFYRPHHTKRLLQFPYAFLPLLVRGPAEGLKGWGSPGWQLSVWGGRLVGVLETPKVLKPGPVVKTAVRGPEDKRWRASGEEAHFLLKGVLSPPIISHCPVESWGARLDIFLFNCLPPSFSYITGELHRCMGICAVVLKNTNALINSVY